MPSKLCLFKWNFRRFDLCSARYTFLFRNEYYTSVYWETFPCDLPLFSCLTNEPSPIELCAQLWYLSGYPYLPYILGSPFQGNLLHRLYCPIDHIELELDKHG